MTKTASQKKKLLSIAKKGCFGKVQHKSMLAAEFVLNQMGGNNTHSLEIYKCRFCNFFHIGHNYKKEITQKNKKQCSTG